MINHKTNFKQCSKCKRILPTHNFHKDASNKTGLHCQCKSCVSYYVRNVRDNRKYRKHRPRETLFKSNRKSSSFLGIHVAERVLSKVFENVEIMPLNNPGYDFICNKGMKIDVKSSCTRIRKNRAAKWAFVIKRNKVADYFLCIAFDNRRDLNPLYLWLIPGNKINMYRGTSISETTVYKWNKYAIDIAKILLCCDKQKKIQSCARSTFRPQGCISSK